MKILGLHFGQPTKQLPMVVEMEPRIRSIDINSQTYLNYGDVIQFLMDENVALETRIALDHATFFTEKPK